MKSKHKIKRLSLTIEEICHLISGLGGECCDDISRAISEAANAPESVDTDSTDDSSLRMILDKIRQKNIRLGEMREKRRLKRQQKLEAANGANDASSSGASSSEQSISRDGRRTDTESAAVENVSIRLTDEVEKTMRQFFNLYLNGRIVIRRFLDLVSPIIAKEDIEGFARVLNIFINITRQAIQSIKALKKYGCCGPMPTHLVLSVSSDGLPESLKIL